MSRTVTLDILRRCRPVIAPSMLKCDFGNLHREVELLESAGAELLHWDVMDGRFVANLSYGAMVINKVRPRTELVFDAHLMITEPERYVDEYVQAGCDAVTIHIEATQQPGEVLNRLRESGCVAGLAINPDTPVRQVEPLLAQCDLVLVMSVQPGFGGQAFRPEVLSKLRTLRDLRPDLLLSIDGGIGPKTIDAAAEAGADLFVVGSAIFDRPDYRAAITDLAAVATRHCPSLVREERN
ncbi:MAG: ribulose-phosphate 3-epimerase [Planctomycetaceae bacterium]|nr:ribulose-phosphate 3-epimerase [Planctomycetaceae bacterium]